MSNWYIPPCQGDTDAFVKYSFDDDHNNNNKDNENSWPTLTVEGYIDHPVVNQTMRIMDKVESIIEPDMLFYMDQETIFNCGNYSYEATTETSTREDPYNDRIKFRHNMRMYCEDVQKLLIPAWRHLRLRDDFQRRKGETAKQPPPTLIQFGDNKQSHVFKDVNVPHIKKFRSASLTPDHLHAVTSSETCYSSYSTTEDDHNNNNINNNSERAAAAATGGLRKALGAAHGNSRVFQPIVWKLASHRHYKKLGDVYRYDTQWAHKKDMAVFRGQLTGSRQGYNKHLSDEENCRNLKRCNLVYNHANSTLIHARLTSTRERLPKILNGVELLAPKVKLDALLEYKGIIMMEGNDVASGLKWALLSQSVVLMPTPKHTSWCMEELLLPWVHYVPLDDFATNVETQMRWVVDHPSEARRISERATLWMEDLVFHPDAKEDDRKIEEEILRRYEAHFFWNRKTTIQQQNKT